MIGLAYEIHDDKRTLAALDRIRARFPGALRAAVRRQALRLRAVMVTGIRNGAPGGVRLLPNAPRTIRLKGSSKPLIHHGDLVRSIGVDELVKFGGGDAEFFVGTNRAARGRNDRQSLATIAEWMEEGTRPHLIPITLRMRGFFRGSFGAELPAGQAYFLHPGTAPRPYLRPSLAFWRRDVERLLREDLRRTFGPTLDTVLEGV